MRLIHIFDKEETARQFTALLAEKHIESHVDPVPNATTFALWVLDEDSLNPAQELLESYLKTPPPAVSPKKILPPLSIKNRFPPLRPSPGAPITFYILFFCILLFTLINFTNPTF